MTDIISILKDVLEFDKIGFNKVDLVIKALPKVDLTKISFPSEEFGGTIESKDGSMEKFIEFRYCHDSFPLYFKSHDIRLTNHVLYYNYKIGDDSIDIYIIDRKYFEERNKDLQIFKDIFIRNIENSEYSINHIYSLDKKEHGANHLYQINNKDDDVNSTQVIVFQKGGRNEEDSTPGVLDIDLLNIVKDRLEGFMDFNYINNKEDSYTKEALDSVKDAISKLEERYKTRTKEGTLGKSIKQ